MNQVVVQKYGGTSVGDVERIRNVAKRIAKCSKGGRLAVVVSAMAGDTNRVIDLVKQVNPRAADSHYDMAVSSGEQVSIALLAAAIEAEGISADPLLAYQVGIRTDSLHSRARIQKIETERIESCWEKNSIPIIAGFQGITDSMDVTTLGRGGSDTSAVALAVALGAECCEINTDVDGVFSADPKVVPDAKLIETLDYDTALELAALGGKVLHSRCVELGAKFKMPIVVRNSFSADSERRTIIMTHNEEKALEAPVVSAVTLDKDVAKITLECDGGKGVSDIFSRVAEAGVNVDIIIQDSLHAGALGFTVSNSDLEPTLDALKKLGSSGANAVRGLAKVSVIGLGMKSHPGVASQVFRALSGAGIGIEMVSTSEIKISCVVKAIEAEKATRVLHESFFTLH